MGKEIKLQDLINSAKPTDIVQPSDTIRNSQEVSIDQIKKTMPEREQEEIKNPEIVDNALKAMHDTLNEKKRFISEEVMPVVEDNARQLAIENELGENEEEISNDVSTPENIEFEKELESENELGENEEEISNDVSTPENIEFEKESESENKVIENKTVKDSLDEETADLENLLNDVESDLHENEFNPDDDEEETDDEIRDRLKKGLTKIKPIDDSIDLSTFSIDEKPTSTSTILNAISNTKTVKKIDWVLLETKKSITMTEASGPELEALRKTMAGSNNINSIVAALKLLYNHIEDANKPSFEIWAKCVKVEDLESLYFALYKACYCDVNLIGRTCEKTKKSGCGKTSVIDHDIAKMVKFEDDETKKKFYEILEHDTTTYTTNIKSTMIAASDSIAISYAEPTLYSSLIQFATLKPEIIEKYGDMLNTMAYINGFYFIDKENKKLKPISIKEYPTNLNKTILSKLKVYASILKTLTSDQYDILMGKLNAIVKESKISYVLPETTCPECGCTIPEEPAGSILDLVFQHRQLAQIKAL